MDGFEVKRTRDINQDRTLRCRIFKKKVAQSGKILEGPRPTRYYLCSTAVGRDSLTCEAHILSDEFRSSDSQILEGRRGTLRLFLTYTTSPII